MREKESSELTSCLQQTSLIEPSSFKHSSSVDFSSSKVFQTDFLPASIGFRGGKDTAAVDMIKFEIFDSLTNWCRWIEAEEVDRQEKINKLSRF